MSEVDLGLSVLAQAGWFAGRRVPIERYLEAIASEGYECTDLVEEFLQECGGLAVGPPASGFAEVIAIDPVTAIETTYKDTVEEYEKVLGTSLVPIGAASSGHLVLMMARDGRFYGGYDAYLAYAGESPAELFGRISSRKLVVIQDDWQ
ncbi:SUKH-3 immunity protein of toxin-antitoxin system [Kribbella voronezhensis]|uniref:SUKH-3 immunity protein of toxin-antitoxin system n=1 Tax=Kribbella voronezhensis TaxID=2512212 RepID=A0A4R7T669_9ACTN|nr:SUKH-3 domain-containing protein [Kribbella voronezhensis]TDU86568.1 SUKH-3 immunity protein of toxin-antitoxin system [Kribbella voronezhensis]